MITVVRMEVGLLAVTALVITQLAFRPITQSMISAPFAFFSVPSVAASVRPAFSAVLVFTSVDAFEMVPVDDSVKARGVGAYTVAGDVAHIGLRLTDLTPNAVYAIQCTRIDSVSGSSIDTNPCSLKKQTITADWKGRASFAIDRGLLEDSSAEIKTAITVVLSNKDGGAPEIQLSYSLPVIESL